MCVTTPIYISFNESVKDQNDNDRPHWFIINTILDSIFGIDIIVNFMTSYYDDNFKLIDDRKVIASKYLRGWFIFDVVAIFPFEAIIKQEKVSANNINEMIRISKLGRLYKLIKLTRLLRMLKLLK